MRSIFKKRKNIFLTIVVVLIVTLLIVIVSFFANFTSSHSKETFLLTSISPNGEFILNAYRNEPGATTDFSVKVYLKNGKSEKLIYDAYHEKDVDIIWIDDSIVQINGRELNIQKKEKYNWRSGAIGNNLPNEYIR